MRIRVSMDGPVVGSDVQEVIDIPDSELAGKSPEEVEAHCDEYAATAFSNYYSYGWSEIGEDEDE